MTTIHTYGEGGYDPAADDGNVIATLDVDDDPQPLDAAGGLATLLAVTGLVPVEHAAAAVGLQPDDLVAEAQAWVAAKQITQAQASAVEADALDVEAKGDAVPDDITLQEDRAFR